MDTSECNCDFPDSEWSEGLLAKANDPAPDLPANWRSEIRLPLVPLALQAYECRYLEVLKEKERDAKVVVIVEQACGNVYQAMESIQLVVGELDERHPATFDALKMLYDNIDPALFYFKRMFARGRPFMCCRRFQSLFPPGHDLYPAHAAYPSGHATQAYATAYFYAFLFPLLTDPLMAAAADIARNREIAGLHYPSDSLAGKILAGQVVDLLFASEKFKAAADRAAAEWKAT